PNASTVRRLRLLDCSRATPSRYQTWRDFESSWRRISLPGVFHSMSPPSRNGVSGSSRSSKTARRLRRSSTPLCDFDWTWPGKIDRKAVEEIATLGFLEDAGNVVLVAPQGLG